jgi:hypothetical protein
VVLGAKPEAPAIAKSPHRLPARVLGVERHRLHLEDEAGIGVARGGEDGDAGEGDGSEREEGTGARGAAHRRARCSRVTIAIIIEGGVRSMRGARVMGSARVIGSTRAMR